MENIIKKIEEIIVLNDQQRAFLTTKFSRYRVEASTVIHTNGMVCKYEFYVVKGLLRTFVNLDGEERTFQFYPEKYWVSDYTSFLQQCASEMSIQAVEDCELIKLSVRDLEELMDVIPQWDKIARRFFERLTVTMQQQSLLFLTKTPEERYLAALKKHRNIITRIPQYMLAQYLGIKPESLSRIKARVAKKNRPS